MGNSSSSNSMDKGRGKELKKILDDHMNTFTKTQCEYGKNYYIPIIVLKRAWERYCKENNITDLLEEYYQKQYWIENGSIFFGDSILIHSAVGIYIGIRLVD
jgi:hypothetical protein